MNKINESSFIVDSGLNSDEFKDSVHTINEQLDELKNHSQSQNEQHFKKYDELKAAMNKLTESVVKLECKENEKCLLSTLR